MLLKILRKVFRANDFLAYWHIGSLLMSLTIRYFRVIDHGIFKNSHTS